MDAIYQWIVLKTFYPGEVVIVAIALSGTRFRSRSLHPGR
jgi:hypothetical protein